jgi:hypothetical protein
MKHLFIGAAAAAAALVGSASARIIVIADLLADRNLVGGDMLQAGPVSIRFGAAAAISARPSAVETSIFINNGFSISNLRFNDFQPGSLSGSTHTLLVNDVSNRFADVGRFAFAGPVVSLRRGGADPTDVTLEAFDVDRIDAPLPAAGLLMLAGLAGIAFASGRRKGI